MLVITEIVYAAYRVLKLCMQHTEWIVNFR